MFVHDDDDDSDCDPILTPYADVVDNGDDEPGCDHVSREVPPPAEEAGEAETRRAEYAADANDAERDPDPMDDLRSTRIAEDPGMDIDAVTVDQNLKELMAVLTRDAQIEITKHDAEILATVRALGGTDAGYRRDQRKAINAIIAEIYSPPRVAAAAK